MPNWKLILGEINKSNARLATSGQSGLDVVRRKYLKRLSRFTGRNVIAYYSGFLSKPNIQGIDITDEDTNGFMATIHQTERSNGLDLILHTPGGSVSAAMSLVHYLTTMFGKNIRVIVPQIAMSAGTMIACSAKSILMSKHSQLGPTDPHLNGVPTAIVKTEFDQACADVKADPSCAPIWQAIIGQYGPTFIHQCQYSLDLSKKFVADSLAANMFAGEADPAAKATDVANKLTAFAVNKQHDRPIFFDECKSLGLSVALIEDDSELQDLVLSAHHCFMHTLTNSRAYKIIENHKGVAIVRQLTA